MSLGRLVRAVLIAVAIGCAVGIVGKVRSQGRMIEDARITITSLSEDNARLEGHLRQAQRMLRMSTIGEGIGLKGLLAGGDSIRIQLGDQTPRMIVTLDPHCVACIEAIPIILSLHETAACTLEWIGLGVASAKEVEAFARERSLPFPVVIEGTGRLWELLPGVVSPVMILFDADGRPAGTWMGVPGDGEVLEIERSLRRMC